MFPQLAKLLSGTAWFLFLCCDIYAADPVTDSTQVASQHPHHFLTRSHDYVLIALVLTAIALLIINYYRIKSRRALQESEERFRAMAERSMVGIAVVQDERFRYVNPRLAEIFGYTEKELVGEKGPADLVHPDDLTIAMQSINRRIAGDEEFGHYEAKVVTKSGDTRLVEIFGSRMRYRGRPAVIATLLDITERRETARLLEKAHSDLNQIFNSAAPLYVISRDFCIERVNDTFCIHIGSNAGDLAGRKCYEVWPGRKCHTPRCPMQAILSGENQIVYEREHVHPDGHKLTFTATALPYRGVDGSVQGMIASFADVTALKEREQALRQSEEKARAQFKSIPAPTYIWQYVDDEFIFIDYSDEALRITGDMVSELVGKTLREIFPDRGDWREAMLQCLKEKKAVRWDKPMPYHYRRTGKDLYLAVSYAYVPPNYVMVHTADVTARTKAEQALRESESRFRELAEKAPVGIFLARTNKVIYANPAVQKVLGYSLEDLAGNPNPLAFVHPDDRHIALGTVEAFAKGKAEKLRYEIRVLAKDGGVRHLEIIASPTTYHGPTTAVGTVVDITERKKAEQALRESEDRFKTLAEQSPAGIYVFRDGRFLYTNPRLKEVLGYSGHDLESFADIMELVLPDDRRQLMAAANRFQESDETSTSEGFRVIAANGELKHVEIYVSKMSYEGSPATIGTLVDVTDRLRAEEALKESEKKFRALAETTSAGIIIYNEEGIVYTNPASAAIMGYSTEELNSMPLWNLARPDYREVLGEVARRRLAGETSFDMNYEIPLITKAGEEIWVLYSASLIQYGGRPAVLGTALDITERRKVAAELQRAQQERYDQVKQIAGGVAHEIYNALFPAVSTLDKLKKRLSSNGDEENGRNVKLVDLADASVSRAIDMTELVTQFSRLDSQVDIELIELKTLIEDVVKDTDRIDLLSVSVDLDIEDSATAKMSRVHAFSLFNNFVKNALDAMEETDVRTLTISARRNAGKTVVRISDTGSGIDPEILPKIFSPFFSTKPRKGTGLGLAICKRIVDIYDGEITVDSALDRGTTFTILVKT